MRRMSVRAKSNLLCAARARSDVHKACGADSAGQELFRFSREASQSGGRDLISFPQWS